ncbi:3-ketoacyl-CoA thiolase 2, peroxisomal-like [Chenopodium quinoa]|uniref:3-ketoacyl-CoA thiolase 2, peroxisomal-like n=1 Tax=Chenopodium quinoa TaxID=63459 RepID=UPI000B76C3F9|nr:3-ketoacyl-CoA thiolase 2, peroxisomal-like [Chenopodium quinoa]
MPCKMEWQQNYTSYYISLVLPMKLTEDILLIRSFAAVGVDPAVMGIGPAFAIPAAVKSAGVKVNDINLFEINEAFASQYVYCCKKLNLDPAKVNVNGGAIALGHPLGATGARCVATLLNEMKRRGRDCRFGVISMCIGSGMGAAAVFERGDHADELTNTRVNGEMV